MLRVLYVILLLLTLVAYLVPAMESLSINLLAIVGLVAPGLWLLTFLITGIDFWKKTHWKWVGLAVLVLGWPMLRNVFAVSTFNSGEGQSIRMASFNANNLIIVTGRENQNRQDSVVAAYIQQLDADIICIQEYRFRYTERLTAAIQKATPFKFMHRIGNSRLVVFSKYPLKNGTTQHFSQDPTNGYSQVEVESPIGRFHLCNVHLQTNSITHLAARLRKKPFDDRKTTQRRVNNIVKRYAEANQSRIQQMGSILEELQVVSLPVIMCGDFNEVPHTYLYQQVRQHFQDAHLECGFGFGDSYEGLLPWLRIDYILPDPSFKIVKFEQFDCPFSDHDAIVATIQ